MRGYKEWFEEGRFNGWIGEPFCGWHESALTKQEWKNLGPSDDLSFCPMCVRLYDPDAQSTVDPSHIDSAES